MKPFKVDTIENAGKNWQIADFGVAPDGKHYILTTNHLHTSNAAKHGNAKTQVELVCKLLNKYYTDQLVTKFLRA